MKRSSTYYKDMSANNQILVKQCSHGQWYVFDCMAESWSDENEIFAEEAKGAFPTEEQAWNFAMTLSGGTEYGAWAYLAKDGRNVIIVCPNGIIEE